MPNEYAKRVKQRHLADTTYLILAEQQGHEQAAYVTCMNFGHDAKAGFCQRCFARVGRDFED